MGWSWALTAGSMISLWMVGNRWRGAFLWGIGVQCGWAAYALSSHQWGFLVGAVFYSGLNLRNWFKWGVEADEEAVQILDTESRPVI